MTLSDSEREFVAVGAAVGAGCHPCTQYHSQAALKMGLGTEEVLGAIEQAQSVRARGGVAVANVGRRILGVDQQEAPAEGPPASRGSALARIGAAAGCNSGVLLAEYAGQAAELGIDAGAVREALDIADMVKTQAGKFLQRDIERVLGRAAESAGSADAPSAGCCGPAQAPEAVEATAGTAAGGGGAGCGCEDES